MNMFQAGDKAVYPTRGVVRILGVEERKVDEKVGLYYVAALDALGGEASLLVPVGGEALVGLRPVASPEDVREALEAVAGPGEAPQGTWNRRYRGYMDKLKAGGLLEVAEVFRDLRRLHGRKGLSFGERRMLDTARALVVAEISAALGRAEAEAEAELERVASRGAV